MKNIYKKVKLIEAKKLADTWIIIVESCGINKKVMISEKMLKK